MKIFRTYFIRLLSVLFISFLATNCKTDEPKETLEELLSGTWIFESLAVNDKIYDNSDYEEFSMTELGDVLSSEMVISENARSFHIYPKDSRTEAAIEGYITIKGDGYIYISDYYEQDSEIVKLKIVEIDRKKLSVQLCEIIYPDGQEDTFSLPPKNVISFTRSSDVTAIR